MFQSGKTSGDYHDDMNFKNFKKWVEEQLITNLPQQSVVVLDNAPYHNVNANPSPNSNSKKADMQNWLIENNIPFSSSMLRTDLYELIKLNKPKKVMFKIDLILKEHGHTAIRLPAYHPELNPIEEVWSEVKRFVGNNNVRNTLESVQNCLLEKFASMNSSRWEKYCNHVKKIENDLYKRECLFDVAVENLIINLNDDGSDSSDSDESSS